VAWTRSKCYSSNDCLVTIWKYFLRKLPFAALCGTWPNLLCRYTSLYTTVHNNIVLILEYKIERGLWVIVTNPECNFGLRCISLLLYAIFILMSIYCTYKATVSKPVALQVTHDEMRYGITWHNEVCVAYPVVYQLVFLRREFFKKFVRQVLVQTPIFKCNRITLGSSRDGNRKATHSYTVISLIKRSCGKPYSKFMHFFRICVLTFITKRKYRPLFEIISWILWLVAANFVFLPLEASEAKNAFH
jgi:hypothetical protein